MLVRQQVVEPEGDGDRLQVGTVTSDIGVVESYASSGHDSAHGANSCLVLSTKSRRPRRGAGT